MGRGGQVIPITMIKSDAPLRRYHVQIRAVSYMFFGLVQNVDHETIVVHARSPYEAIMRAGLAIRFIQQVGGNGGINIEVVGATLAP